MPSQCLLLLLWFIPTELGLLPWQCKHLSLLPPLGWGWRGFWYATKDCNPSIRSRLPLHELLALIYFTDFQRSYRDHSFNYNEVSSPQHLRLYLCTPLVIQISPQSQLSLGTSRWESSVYRNRTIKFLLSADIGALRCNNTINKCTTTNNAINY